MAGFNRHTGKPISGWPEVAQSLDTLLTTLVGESIRRRSKGIDEVVIQDRPMNSIEITDAFIGIAEAIEPRMVNGRQLGEPRFDLVRVVPFRAGPDGQVGFELQGLYYPRGLTGDYSIFEQANYGLGTVFA
jgi:phage baseplate assembly protein W